MAQSDAAAVARATQEIQAALVIAQRVGRDDVKVEARVLTACKRPELAEVAEYEYSRGGTKITGPTIDLIRAIANRVGNIRYGWTEVDRRTGPDGVGLSSVRCFAWDLYTNSQSERTFVVKHWRDTNAGGYKLEEERDIYETMANQASRRVRACLEEVIDADLVNKAVDACRLTLKQGSKGVPLKDRAAKMLVAFAEFGVTQDMIERRLGNKLDAVSENQIASLTRVFKSLRDGIGKREDYFKPETSKPEFAGAETTPGPSGTNPPVDQPAAAATPSGAQGAAVGGSSAPAPAPDSPLKVLRRLCAEVKPPIKEGKLLEHLATTGSTDGSVSGLEELAMVNPSLIASVIDNWPDVVAQLTGD